MELAIAKHPAGGGRVKIVALWHAFPLNHWLFDRVTPPDGWQLWLPDFPGFGDTPLAGPWTFTELAEAFHRYVQEAAPERFIFGGVSMGGYLALEYARRFSEYLDTLVLVSTRLTADDEAGKKKRYETAEHVRKNGTQAFAKAMAGVLLAPSTRKNRPDLEEAAIRWIEAADPQAVAQASIAMAARPDQRDFAQNGWKKPLFWAAGEEDQAFAASEQEHQSQLFQDGRFELFPRCGHLPPWEAPDAFQQWLEKIAQAVDNQASRR